MRPGSASPGVVRRLAVCNHKDGDQSYRGVSDACCLRVFSTEGQPPRPIFDKTVSVKQLSVVEVHGLLILRVDKGQSDCLSVGLFICLSVSVCLYVSALASFSLCLSLCLCLCVAESLVADVTSVEGRYFCLFFDQNILCAAIFYPQELCPQPVPVPGGDQQDPQAKVIRQPQPQRQEGRQPHYGAASGAATGCDNVARARGAGRGPDHLLCAVGRPPAGEVPVAGGNTEGRPASGLGGCHGNPADVPRSGSVPVGTVCWAAGP